jgi:hypothetical protein
VKCRDRLPDIMGCTESCFGPLNYLSKRSSPDPGIKALHPSAGLEVEHDLQNVWKSIVIGHELQPEDV